MKFNILFTVLLFLFCNINNTIAGTKKIIEGVSFEGSLDYEKMPVGQGTMHVYNVSNKKNVYFSIFGTFKENEITNAEIKLQDCTITGNLYYKCDIDPYYHTPYFTLQLKSIKIKEHQYLGETKSYQFTTPIVFSLSGNNNVIPSKLETESFNVFTSKEYGQRDTQGYIGDGEERQKTIFYGKGTFQEFANFFNTSIISFGWTIAFGINEFGDNKQLQLFMERSNFVGLENNSYIYLQPFLSGTSGYYKAYDDDEVSFRANNNGTVWFTKIHITSVKHIVYDGEWDSQYIGENNFEISIKYPNGNKFEGVTYTDFLRMYDGKISLDLFKIFKESDGSLLRPYKGTLTTAQGTKKNIISKD